MKKTQMAEGKRAGALGIGGETKTMPQSKYRGKLPVLQKPVSAVGSAVAIEHVSGLQGTDKTERQGSAEKQSSLEKTAENKAAPKVKNSIWDTSGNGTLEATGQPEFMPFGREQKADKTLSGLADQAEDAKEGKKLLEDDHEALLWAADEGDVTKVRQLIACGADLHIADSGGLTPLHWAAEYGHVAVVEQLLAAGAHKEAKAQFGKTPLHTAAMRGYAAVVGQLLAAGADKDATDKRGQTPLQLAVIKKHAAVAEMLREAGAQG
ncbi:ankyrin repeat-containing domain protein [Baffinella frigidus]|nr:ankyrin repeat-containing domain protein [Cryptophyta sp. CCMP2293]